MSITEKILNLLNTKTANYKGIPVNCFGFPIFKEYGNQSVKNSFSRLHSRNFIKYDEGYIKITKEGKEYVKKKNTFLHSFYSTLNEVQEKNLLVLFDIPEKRRSERNWFRLHLKRFGYIMIQQSVWVGPSPLPKEFVKYVKEIKLQESIKTFKLAIGYQNKKIGL
jgi:CRISPR-associated endonuclease Cas2